MASRTTPRPRSRTFASFAVANYRLFFLGALVSNLGTWVQRIGQDWLVLPELTDHSSTALGIVTALQFLAVDGDASERELEQRMVDRILQTMQELGPGFAFVGRQVHVEIDGDDFYIDLLLFHVEQLRSVVIELKTTTFTPADTGQLGFYVTVVDDLLRMTSGLEWDETYDLGTPITDISL